MLQLSLLLVLLQFYQRVFPLHGLEECNKTVGPLMNLNFAPGSWLNVFVDRKIPCSGPVQSWQFYANRTGTFYADIWRPLFNSAGAFPRYRLIGKNKINVQKTGAQVYYVPTSELVNASSGDVLGIHYPDGSDPETGGVVPYEDSRNAPTPGAEFYRTSSMMSRIHNAGSYNSGLTIGATVTGFISGSFVKRSPAIFPEISNQILENFGYNVTSASETDRWTNFVLITNPQQGAPQSGVVTGWRVSAGNLSKKFQLYLQIWRPVSDSSSSKYKLVGQTMISRRTDPQITRINLLPAEQFRINKGDVLGFRNFPPYSSPIKFKRTSCIRNNKGLYRRYSQASVSVGQSYSFTQLKSGWGACRKYSYQAIVSYDKNTSSADTNFGTVGHFPLGSSLELDGWTNFMKIPDPSAAVQRNGTVIQWRLKLQNPGFTLRTANLHLQIWRPESVGNTYKLVSEKSVYERVYRNGLEKNFTTSVRVQKGDVIGFRNVASKKSLLPFERLNSNCPNKRRVLYKRFLPLVVVGRSYSFTTMPTTYGACRDYTLEAVIKYDSLNPVITTATPPTDRVTLGSFPTQNLELDGWENYMYMLNPDISASQSGIVIGWKVMLKQKSSNNERYKVALQIWRPSKFTGSLFNTATLVDQTQITGRFTQPEITRHVEAGYRLQAGDLIGFRNFNGYKSAIPYLELASTCPASSRTFYYRHSYTASVGRQYQFIQMPISYGPCRQYALQATIKYDPLTTPSILTSTKPPTSTILATTAAPVIVVTNSTNQITAVNPFTEYTQLARGENHVILPDTSVSGSAPIAGYIEGWQFFANNSNTVHFQVWRPVQSNRYRLVGETVFSDITPGYNDFMSSTSQYVGFKPGDTFGLYFPSGESIPFRNRESNCRTHRGKIHQSFPPFGDVEFQDLDLSQDPCRVYAVQTRTSLTHAPTVQVPLVDFGGSLKAGEKGQLDKWTNFMLIPDRKFKIAKDGRVEAWTIQARLHKDVFLQIWRMGRSTRYWSLVGESEIKAAQITPNITQRIDLSESEKFKVKKGDVLGVWFPGDANIPFTIYKPCSYYGRYIRNYSNVRSSSGPKTVSIMNRYWGRCRKYAIIAHINEASNVQRR